MSSLPPVTFRAPFSSPSTFSDPFSEAAFLLPHSFLSHALGVRDFSFCALSLAAPPSAPLHSPATLFSPSLQMDMNAKHYLLRASGAMSSLASCSLRERCISTSLYRSCLNTTLAPTLTRERRRGKKKKKKSEEVLTPEVMCWILDCRFSCSSVMIDEQLKMPHTIFNSL